jgi:hypothetical protein
MRNCRSNPPEICAGGNWGPVPRELLRQQLHDLGRVPHERYVKDIVCVVADPTGTPLNVRKRPNGQILGALSNNTKVVVNDQTVVSGKTWSEIVPETDGKQGWVFHDYLDCSEEK